MVHTHTPLNKEVWIPSEIADNKLLSTMDDGNWTLDGSGNWTLIWPWDDGVRVSVMSIDWDLLPTLAQSDSTLESKDENEIIMVNIIVQIP